MVLLKLGMMKVTIMITLHVLRTTISHRSFGSQPPNSDAVSSTVVDPLVITSSALTILPETTSANALRTFCHDAVLVLFRLCFLFLLLSMVLFSVSRSLVSSVIAVVPAVFFHSSYYSSFL